MAKITFTPPAPLQTAVLFLIFNRPDTTKQVFDAIRKAQPPRLYIAADGPRDSVEGEKEKVEKAREIVSENIDWVCDVKTLFRKKNLGCKYAVSEAITWFFEQEEEGIIIEDDCLPSQSFFWFCETLLNKYRDDERIFSISATHYQDPMQNSFDTPYYLSNYPLIWGWASWRKKWHHYSLNIDDYISIILKNDRFNFLEKIYWLSIFKKVHSGNTDTWDYQWMLTCWRNKAYCLRSGVNQSQNIGFGSEATHTKDANNLVISFKLHEIVVSNFSYPVSLSYRKDYDSSAVRVFANVSFKGILGINFPILSKLKKFVQSLSVCDK